ncbi:MAG: hypothetical protein ACFFGZ_19370 [Candidatus Thorarchaeota archaeon]
MVIPSNRREKIFLKDDYIRDLEGIIYLVILNSHPPESIVAIPKYVPKQGGKWRGTYRRLFRNYTSSEFHKVSRSPIFRRYEFYSNSFGKKLLAIPNNLIAQHFVPENKLKELMLSPRKELGSLERNAIDLAKIFSEFGIKQNYMGITGSLLYNLHMPFSNLSIILYGLKGVVTFLHSIDEIVTENDHINFKSQFLDLGDKQIELGSRIRTFLWMNDVSTAIHVNEFPDFHFIYGSELARSLGKCEIIGSIHNVYEGFIRKNYVFRLTEVINRLNAEEKLPESLRLRIFSGRSEDIIFKEGELVRASGVLQWVESIESRQEKPFFQLSVGLEEFPGYACPLSILPKEI